MIETLKNLWATDPGFRQAMLTNAMILGFAGIIGVIALVCTVVRRVRR